MCVKYEKNGHEEIYQKLFLSGWPKNWLSQVTTRGLPLVKESDLMVSTKPGYVLLTFLLFPINSKGQSCVNDLLCKVTCYSLNFMGVGIRLQGKPYSWEAVKCGTFVLASNRHALMEVMGILRGERLVVLFLEVKGLVPDSVWYFWVHMKTSITVVFKNLDASPILSMRTHTCREMRCIS